MGIAFIALHYFGQVFNIGEGYPWILRSAINYDLSTFWYSGFQIMLSLSQVLKLFGLWFLDCFLVQDLLS